MSNVVLVADMIRGFMEPNHNLYLGNESRQIIPRVRKLLEHETASGSRVIFIVDTHDPDDPEFAIFAPHCVRGTDETEIIPELRHIPGETLPKQHYSAFFGTGLEERLAELKPPKVIICGVCTDICVMHTSADARNLGYPVEVPSDCVATFDEDSHRWALKHMREILGVEVLDAE